MPRPLHVGKILVGAIAIPWGARKEFARALALPFFTLVAVGLAQRYLAEMGGLVAWGLATAHILVFVYFAVRCHRLVLLGAHEVLHEPSPLWSRRNTRFLLRLVAAVALFIGTLFLMAGVLAIFGVLELWKSASIWDRALVGFAMLAPASIVLARVSPAFPAMALDRAEGIGWAWNLTHRNALRMWVVTGMVPIATSAVVNVLTRVLPGFAAPVVASLLTTALLVFEISALSLAYRELTREEKALPQS